ncbi:DoxX family protein [Natrarchaeobius halalkaliphilus]|uniref:DoxX family protein n=1 Tax=Natrarchaeobius halalkaliphilus TaxID=1679091 RepID=A0A3N6LLI1_9EURY|nr:DoxX family protein [Natrarchaeobius halalkaliphilus]RQG87980.1 DoxX family protein [Natrarchaeobius halalkaliphilus]
MATKPRPVEQTLESTLIGRTVSFNYSETWVAYSIFGLRLVMAWVFLQAGLAKWADGGWGDPLAWSSTDFLNNVVAETNPLYELFLWFDSYAAIVDPLVIVGQILIGLALLFGIGFRFAALMGAIQMLFFWTAAWNAGLLAGFPVENGFFIDSSFVYMLLLFGLAAWGAGRLAGIDATLEETALVRENPWLRYLLG